MSDSYLMTVEGDGTLEYDALATGNFAGFPTELRKGSTLRGGPLDGLELVQVNRVPQGSIGGVSYRYFGNYDDSCVFEVTR